MTSQTLANQDCLFDRSVNTSLCIIFDHKAAFVLVKTVIRNSLISIYGKDIQIIIHLSYNIEECLTSNDYFTDKHLKL